MNGSADDEIIGEVPGFKGGYFPPLILELFNRIVSSFTESLSNGIGLVLGRFVRSTRSLPAPIDCVEIWRLRDSAFVMSDSQAVRQRVR